MADKRKLSTIMVAFTNGTIRVFNNVEDIRSDERTLRLSIADQTYYTRVFLDKILYFEEVIDDNSVTYYADGAAYIMSEGGENS